MRQLDSFKFMNASLDKLLHNLPPVQFSLLEQHFQELPTSSVNPLKQKGSFFYCYGDSFEKLQETQLPPRDKWTNSLQQYKVTASEDENKQTLQVFNLFFSWKCWWILQLVLENWSAPTSRSCSLLSTNLLWHLRTGLLSVLHCIKFVGRRNAQKLRTL